MERFENFKNIHDSYFAPSLFDGDGRSTYNSAYSAQQNDFYGGWGDNGSAYGGNAANTLYGVDAQRAFACLQIIYGALPLNVTEFGAGPMVGDDQSMEERNEEKGVYEEVTYANKCIIYRLNNPEATAWDLDGDGKLSKSEADKWYVNGKGVPIIVDNSKIDWFGLEIPRGKNNGDGFAIGTSQAFWELSYETAGTYGGTSFVVKDISKGIVEVQRQPYHYEYRSATSVENVFRNIATGIGMPTPFDATGQAYMIFYSNPIIYINK